MGCSSIQPTNYPVNDGNVIDWLNALPNSENQELSQSSMALLGKYGTLEMILNSGSLNLFPELLFVMLSVLEVPPSMPTIRFKITQQAGVWKRLCGSDHSFS